MNNLLLVSTILITLALVFYSTGIWSERFSKYLKKWHVIMFWTGFFFDVTGTLAMTRLANHAFNLMEMHTLTGQIALWLMLIHASWATYVVRKGSEKLRKNFHRYSILVWLIWLIPYFGGMFMGMMEKGI
jgi:uncharacterized repeat protein (TIGR03987 family)